VPTEGKAMKATRLVALIGPHPAYNRTAARAAKAAGKEYTIEPTITYPAGSVCEHPHSWIHCCTAQPTMAPADDECRVRVHYFLNHPRRRAQLTRLKSMASPEVFAKLPQDLQHYVATLRDKWHGQLADVDESTLGTDTGTDTELTFEPLDSLTQ
jgi:hypothetical protein